MKRRSRRRACAWGGATLAAAGVCVAMVAWVGLDRTNLYLGVAGSVAGVLGLVVGVYGAVTQNTDPRGIRLVLQRTEVGGNNRMTGRAGRSGDADISMTISDARISGNNIMTGEAESDVEYPEQG